LISLEVCVGPFHGRFGEREPDTIATPEGDGEFAPDEPLAPAVVESDLEGLQTPPGNAPAEYESDHHNPTATEKAVDEISHGTLLP
jgi:hypothetical protein